MSLFYAMRPSDEPVGWDSQRGRPKHLFTRFGQLQTRRDRAVKQARRVKGRAYEYDGEHRLIYDHDAPDNVHEAGPDNVREDARARERRQARRERRA